MSCGVLIKPINEDCRVRFAKPIRCSKNIFIRGSRVTLQIIFLKYFGMWANRIENKGAWICLGNKFLTSAIRFWHLLNVKKGDQI